MKSILKVTALVAMTAFVSLSGTAFGDDTTTSSQPNNPAPGGTPASTDSKNQENTPAGPADQNATGTTGTPQQTKTGDTATTDKPLSNGSPNEATKKPKHKKHKKDTTTQTESQTNTAPSGGMDNK